MCKNCSIIVNSCDNYEDTWMPFFKLFNKYWANNTFDIYLNTESKSYSYENLPIKCLKLFNGCNKVSWSKRLLETLKHIDSEFVVLMFDDFFIKDYVDDALISQLINYMNINKEIGVTYLTSMPSPYSDKDCDYDIISNIQFTERTKNMSKTKYFLSLFKRDDNKEKACYYIIDGQVGIWRRDFLMKSLNVKENAHEWEFYGSLRAYKYDKKIISVKYFNDNILKYNMGYDIFSGYWFKSYVGQVFKDNEIDIDFSKRGVWEEQNKIKNGKNINIFKKIKSLINISIRILRR